MNTEVISAKSELLIFAHELRQPLSSILLAAQCLNEVADHDSSTREMCQIVERQSRFVVRLIEEVLAQCHGHAATLCLREDWFDLSMVIASAVEATGSLLKERASHLTVLLPPEQLWVHADPLRIQQILINLLTNAAKYTEPGGRIQLVAELAAGSIVIEVNDDGVGIPEASLPRVFDLFERSVEPAQNHIAGLGIGLALVKSLVELQGGTITVHSAGTGRGATFVVRLPERAPGGLKPPLRQKTSKEKVSFAHHLETDAMSDA